MKTQTLLIAAVSLLVGVEAVRAAPAALAQAYVAGISAQADAKVANAGVALPTAVRVRGVISGDRLQNARLVTSTGDLAADRAVEQALRRLKVATPPAELSGREVTITVGPQPQATS